MVRSDGKPYRKASQKGPRGGKTRREILSDKLSQKRRRLREKGLVELTCSSKACSLARQNDNDLAVYGLYKDEDASYDERWVLTALSVSDRVEKMNHHRGGGHSRTEVRGRYVITPRFNSEEVDPQDGLVIERFEKKSEAMRKASADGSNRVENGYLIRPKHDSRTLYGEEFDKEAWQTFKRNATRVRE